MATRRPRARDICCLSCHFLELREDFPAGHLPGRNPESTSAGGKVVHRVFDEKDRAEILRAPAPHGNRRLACWKDVWRHLGGKGDSVGDVLSILTQSRAESCFFYPRTPGMTWRAAEELERRAAERRESQRDRRLIRLAFYVVLGALLVSAVTGAANLAFLLWKEMPTRRPVPVQPAPDREVPSDSASPSIL